MSCFQDILPGERESERKGNPESKDETRPAQGPVQLWYQAGHLQRKCSHVAGICSVRSVQMFDNSVHEVNLQHLFFLKYEEVRREV